MELSASSLNNSQCKINKIAQFKQKNNRLLSDITHFQSRSR